MRAVILAGGESSRFWPLSGCHKSLLEVAGEPLIARTINNLPRVDEVVVVGPGNCMQKALRGVPLNKEVEFRVQTKPQGMWDAILLGAEDYSDDVLVASGHQFSRFALNKLSAGSGTKLLLSRVDDPTEYGVARVEGKEVVGIDEKPAEPPSDLAVNSLYRLSHDFIHKLAASGGKDHYLFERVLSDYLREHPADFEVVPKEEVPSLKYPWDALSVAELVLERLKGDVRGDVSEGAFLKGEVVVEEGASVAAGAHVHGPAYVGKGAFVGTSSLVRQTCLERGSLVGFGSEVARSLVGSQTKMHHAYVGDSVIGPECWLGFGVVTANRRFDKEAVGSLVKGEAKSTGRGHFGCAVGRGSRFGINAMLMPGVLVGSGVTIGPGTAVDENVPDGKLVYVKQEKRVK